VRSLPMNWVRPVRCSWSLSMRRIRSLTRTRSPLPKPEGIPTSGVVWQPAAPLPMANTGCE
jgi:hypothetical protein